MTGRKVATREPRISNTADDGRELLLDLHPGPNHISRRHTHLLYITDPGTILREARFALRDFQERARAIAALWETVS